MVGPEDLYVLDLMRDRGDKHLCHSHTAEQTFGDLPSSKYLKLLSLISQLTLSQFLPTVTAEGGQN